MFLKGYYEKQCLYGFFLVFPDGDEVFGFFDELFGFAPGGVDRTAGYAVKRLDGVFEAFREFGVFGAVFGEKGLNWGSEEDLEGVDEAAEFFVAVAGHVAAGAGEEDAFEALLEFFVFSEEILEVQLAEDEVGGKAVGGHVDELHSGVGGHVFDVLIGRDEEAHAGAGVYFLAESDGFAGVG